MTKINKAHDGKISFSTRRDAKNYLRRRHYKNQHPYACSSCRYWHLGHIPHDIRFDAANSQAYLPIPEGVSHSTIEVSGVAELCVRAIFDDGTMLKTSAMRVVSRIAYIQRTELRNPGLVEAAELPDEFWEAAGAPVDSWDGDDTEWIGDIATAAMVYLAQKRWINMDARGNEVRIGHKYASTMHRKKTLK